MSHTSLPRRTVLAGLASLGLGSGPLAWAQASAAVPIRILVGAPAGGTTDTMARTLAQAMGQQLGRAVVVENRPGAVATSPPKRWPKPLPMATPC